MADLLHNEFRDEAIAEGRRGAGIEADLRGETGEVREERIHRAEAYAAWEFDGRPDGEDDRYRIEFGLPVRVPMGIDRVAGKANFKEERKKK